MEMVPRPSPTESPPSLESFSPWSPSSRSWRHHGDRERHDLRARPQLPGSSTSRPGMDSSDHRSDRVGHRYRDRPGSDVGVCHRCRCGGVVHALQLHVLPYYPFWSLAVIALDVLVIWRCASSSPTSGPPDPPEDAVTAWGDGAPRKRRRRTLGVPGDPDPPVETSISAGGPGAP